MESDAWYKPRGYIHFDRAASKQATLKIVTSPSKVASHSFYPFLRYILSTQKTHFDKSLKKVKKKEPKLREISYAAHLDSHIYSYYCSALSGEYEAYLSSKPWKDSILAFRALGKSNIDFSFKAFSDIKAAGECCAIGIDIKGFFDNLDHALLKEAWAKILDQEQLPADHYAIFRSLTKYSYVLREDLFKELNISKSNPGKDRSRLCSPEEFREIVRAKGLILTNKSGVGIPQGSPISAMLSNIYMMNFDEIIFDYAACLGGFYYRYCDDILLIVPINEKGPSVDLVRSEISKLKLEIQEAKTEARIFTKSHGGLRADKPLQYLGFLFDGQKILLRSSSLTRYQERVSRGLWLAGKTMEKFNNLRVERGQLPRSLYLKKLYKRYSYLGRRNFISYGYRAARDMNSASIRKQLKSHWPRLRAKIAETQKDA